MRIVSCCSSPAEAAALAEAGAAELYCAVNGLPSFGEYGQLKNLAELGRTIEEGRRLGLRVALAVNSPHAVSTAVEWDRTLARLKRADSMGLGAFIVANPGLLRALAGLPGRKAELHLSSVQPAFNAAAAELFLRAGVSRIILPNQLAPAEARGIIAACRAAGAATEIFDYRFFGCAYVNGRCRLHTPEHYTPLGGPAEGSLCRVNSSPAGLVGVSGLDLPGRAAEAPAAAARLAARITRGGAPRISNAATFFDFWEAGVQYLKYGTRQDPVAVKVRKVGELRRALSLAAELSGAMPRAKARAEFIKVMTTMKTERVFG